ncbi:MAG: sigma 54-interacting transcriptional regulator [Candidatus Pacebacteria bacterium]|nr:sigma 54-interacting transcriptional regulator [Candidatus Paceibacterota bacterium]
MPLLTKNDCQTAEAFSTLAFCNPFLPERVDCEKRILGRATRDEQRVWSARVDDTGANKTLSMLQDKAEALVQTMRAEANRKEGVTPREQQLYEDVAAYVLYYRFQNRFLDLIEQTPDAAFTVKYRRVTFFDAFHADANRLLNRFPGRESLSRQDVAHLFACFFQVRRAFHHIFRCIFGGSMTAARLRAAVWQSIFTHNMRRYRQYLYDRLGDMSVLITGASGTGKELVARAIGLSRYIPFDPDAEAFAADWQTSFHALNLSALSATLIEAELFGHRRGAFTGAEEAHAGWFEACGPHGTVFLDEIGDANQHVQIKLLRLLESRTFSRLGETEPRTFNGKVIAATNRDLGAAMEEGAFRQDLYYRLCADTIHTPPLHEQLADSPRELENLVRHLCERIAGGEHAESLQKEVTDWIEKNMGRNYSWPGNVRELEQCVRNILIRRSYKPPVRQGVPSRGRFAGLHEGRFTADELLNQYCAHVYEQCGSYEEAGRRLRLDRRTVKRRVTASRQPTRQTPAKETNIR